MKYYIIKGMKNINKYFINIIKKHKIIRSTKLKMIKEKVPMFDVNKV